MQIAIRIVRNVPGPLLWQSEKGGASNLSRDLEGGSPGVPVDEMHLVSVKLTLYVPEDCSWKTLHELLNRRILPITGEAFGQGTLLTQVDLAILLSESTKTIARHIQELENNGEVVPTRGSWKDIGPGVSH